MVAEKANTGQINVLKHKLKEYKENWKRAVADYQNLKKRTEREIAEFTKYANQRLLANLLSVRDALAKAGTQVGSEAGIGLILKQLDDLFNYEGVSKIAVKIGDEFDPTIMTTIATKKTKHKAKKNTIAKIYRDGFKYKDRILRAVEVEVYNGA